MNSENYNRIKDAIKALCPLEFDYANKHRRACPHILGHKGEDEHVLVYQFAGESQAGLKPEGGWRCFKISKIQNLQNLHEGASWHTLSVNREPTCLDSIELKVKLVVESR